MFKTRFAIFIGLFISGPAFAADLEGCRPLADIKSEVTEGYCEEIEHEAELCFERVNFQLEAVKKNIKQLSDQEFASEKERLLKVYDEALARMNGEYTDEINVVPESCLKEAAALTVWIDEFERDREDLFALGKTSSVSAKKVQEKPGK